MKVNVDNQCKFCASIEFITISSSNGLRSCRTCNLNQIVVDNVCTDCEPGFVRDDEDSTKCKACEANQISTPNGCITCLDETAIGKYAAVLVTSNIKFFSWKYMYNMWHQ